MNLELHGKVALIVGASGSIGWEISKTFAREGCHLALNGRNAEKLNRLKLDLNKANPHGNYYCYPADVQSAVEAKKLYETCLNDLGRIDILVNCMSGPNVENQATMNESEETWHDSLNGKLTSYIRMANLVLTTMKAQGFGKIINIAGLSAKEPSSKLLISGVINAGIINYTKAIAKEYGAYNISINAINPGFIASDRYHQYVNNNAELEKAIKNRIPLNRIGSPKDIANMVAYLASEAANYITGTTITIDGGVSASAF